MGFRKKIRWLLYPVSLLYGLVVSIRNWLYNSSVLETHEFNIPVISVGNITVGGTGKTPHTEYLLKIFKNQLIAAVLSRGYKRKTRGYLKSDINSSVYDIGDEPCQIKKKFPEVDVVVCADRVKGIKRMLKEDAEKKLDVIVLDDAYQHRHIKAGVSILLIDYFRPLERDHLLPYGDLRENPYERYRANIIIVTKTPEDIKPIDKRIFEKNINIFPYQSLYFSTITYGNPISLLGQKSDSDVFTNKPLVLLVTGIASPTPLWQFIKSKNCEISTLEYPDHYNFKEKDLIKISGTFNEIKNQNKIILTTEKDAMRIINCSNKEILINLPFYYISIEVKFLGDDETRFNNQIINYVRKNKRNDRLHKKQDTV